MNEILKRKLKGAYLGTDWDHEHESKEAYLERCFKGWKDDSYRSWWSQDWRDQVDSEYREQWSKLSFESKVIICLFAIESREREEQVAEAEAGDDW